MVMAAHHCEWSSCHSIVHVKWFLYILSVSFMSCTFYHNKKEEYISSVQLLSHVQHFTTPWTAARQGSLSITDSRRLPKLMPIELVMPSSHLILCCPLLLPPSIIPSIRVFSSESVLHIRWPKYWSFSFSISPSDEYSGRISLQSKGLSRVFSNTTVQSINTWVLSFLYNPTLTSIHDHWKNHSFD